MKIVENDIDIIRTWLSRRFWEANRWLVFDRAAPYIAEEELFVFRSFEAAALYCQEHSSAKRVYKVIVLGDMLRWLNDKLITDQREVADPRLSERILDYPITFMSNYSACIGQLAQGSYYPVLWNSLLHPLKAIGRYYLIEQRSAIVSGLSIKYKNAVAGKYDRFDQAMQQFQRFIKYQTNAQSSAVPQLLLTGVW